VNWHKEFGMAEQTINLEGLRGEVRGAVGELAVRLVKDLGDKLQSLTVVGSALTPDFQAKRSDINTVLVVEHRSHELLKLLASYGKALGRLRLHAPLLLTEEYITDSREVFGVEFLDFQLNHFLVVGTDPFAGLTFEKNNVRLQCERELKSALITLRQGYIRCGGAPKVVGQMLMNGLGKMLPLLRAMLWLKDAPRATEAQRTVDEAGRVFKFDAAALGQLLALRAAGKVPDAKNVDVVFQEVYRILDHLAHVADGTKVI
jgi:hypothetical protein